MSGRLISPPPEGGGRKQAALLLFRWSMQAVLPGQREQVSDLARVAVDQLAISRQESPNFAQCSAFSAFLAA